jgi:hypothetical protein
MVSISSCFIKKNNTCINVINLDRGVKTTDGKVGIDLVELNINDAHAVTTVNKERFLLEV